MHRPKIGKPRKATNARDFRFAGVDEAGRGPVLGPMVIAICALTERDKRWCAVHNITDSKLIQAARRDKLAKALMDRCWYSTTVIHPPEIDEAVRNRSVTLNGLEFKYMAELIKQFHAAHPDAPAEIMVDAPVRKTLPFRNLLQYLSGWPDINSLKAENEADLWHRHVGAASIIAKYEREKLVREIKDRLGCDIGCGYSHDPLARAYVAKAVQGDPIVRWSWVTAMNRITDPEDEMLTLL